MHLHNSWRDGDAIQSDHLLQMFQSHPNTFAEISLLLPHHLISLYVLRNDPWPAFPSHGSCCKHWVVLIKPKQGLSILNEMVVVISARNGCHEVKNKCVHYAIQGLIHQRAPLKWCLSALLLPPFISVLP
jgi:hypothetical protein